MSQGVLSGQINAQTLIIEAQRRQYERVCSPNTDYLLKCSILARHSFSKWKKFPLYSVSARPKPE